MSGRVVSSHVTPAALVADWLDVAASDRRSFAFWLALGPRSSWSAELQAAGAAVLRAHRHALRAARAYRRLAPRLPG